MLHLSCFVNLYIMLIIFTNFDKIFVNFYVVFFITNYTLKLKIDKLNHFAKIFLKLIFKKKKRSKIRPFCKKNPFTD